MNKRFSNFLVCLLAVALFASGVSAFAEDVVSAIVNIRTTQAFTDDSVPEDDLNMILDAGLSATSAINQQPWFFAVIQDRDLMLDLSSGSSSAGNPPAFSGADGAPADFDGALPDFNGAPPEGMPNAGAMGNGSEKAALGDSPVAIIVYKNDNTKSPDASFDCGLACQNMIVAANALGYGAKIISSPTMTLNGTDHDAICEKLGVDASYNAVAVLLIGIADMEIDATSSASVRNTRDEMVSFASK